MTTENQRRSSAVGVIGLGNMGTPMTLNLIREGDARVVVTGRSRDRATTVLEAGAEWLATPREVAEAAATVLLMVPDLPDIEGLCAGPDGLLAADGALLLIVGASVSPVRVREFGDRLRESTEGRVRVVDAPVSGGVEGASAGTLSIMIGGEDQDVRDALPVLDRLGRPVHLGPLGSGSIVKACNQMIVGATVLALAESAVLAERSGIDLERMFDLLGGGYAASRVMETRARRFVEHDHTPDGVARYMLKDLGFAAAVAEETGTDAPLLPAVRSAFAELVDRGFGDQDLAVAQAYVAAR